MTTAELRALDALDVEGMVNLTSELVRIPSVGGEEGTAQDRVADWMREEGLEVDRWRLDLDGLRAHPAFSAEVERASGVGVVGTLGEDEGGRTLIFNGHVDVVPPGDPDQWRFDPWSGEVTETEVRGRGSLDMKGGLSAALFAARAIRDSGVRLTGTLLLESVIGEEDGGTGTLAAIERGYRGDGAVIMEPTNLAVCTAQAGSLNFRITVRGRSAHGCVRDEGVSALEKFLPIHEELLALEARRNHNTRDPLFREYRIPFPLSVGIIRGGDWPSTVPDRVVAEGRYGVAPDEDPEEARAQFVDAVERAVRGDAFLKGNPPEIEWWGGTFHPARVSQEVAVVRELLGASTDLDGRAAPLAGVTFGSDMRLLVREGRTPAVLFGPGDVRRAHAPDESVAIRDLERTARTLILTALRFCGYEDV